MPWICLGLKHVNMCSSCHSACAHSVSSLDTRAHTLCNGCRPHRQKRGSRAQRTTACEARCLPPPGNVRKFHSHRIRRGLSWQGGLRASREPQGRARVARGTPCARFRNSEEARPFQPHGTSPHAQRMCSTRRMQLAATHGLPCARRALGKDKGGPLPLAQATVVQARFPAVAGKESLALAQSATTGGRKPGGCVAKRAPPLA